jgi:RNA polymerase sigma-70 factor (ECF subfamily)
MSPPATATLIAPASFEAMPAPPVSTGLDAESQAWIEALKGDGPERDDAHARLHDLLLRAAHFEINRRRVQHPHLRGNDLDDLATQCAADAMVAVLRKLDSFRGDSRFTTWAYKFALLEAAVTLRRRAWQQREIPLEDPAWDLIASHRASPAATTEHDELFAAVSRAIAEDLTPHQREVLVATTLDGVPIDVLAERMETTRGALYKTLHDARRKLRARLAEQGLSVVTDQGETP